MDAEKERNRIRDNQRRSRARKKEYVQELEQRLRECQLKGIEASAEVQQAARRVANENQKLRKLLNNVGLSDEQVDQFLKTGTAEYTDRHRLQRHPSGSSMPGNAASALDSLMVARRPDCLDLTKPLRSPSQHTNTDQVLSYDTGSNSPADSYAATPEDARQSPYGMESAPPIGIPQAAYRQVGELPGQRFATEDQIRHGARWPPNHMQPSSGLVMNLQGYGENQTIDFHPSFTSADTTSTLPPNCRAQVTPSYSAYETIPQPPNFIASQLGGGSASHSGPASVSDTDSSAEGRRSRQAGNVDAYPWMPSDTVVGSHYNARELMWNQYPPPSPRGGLRPSDNQQHADTIHVPSSDRKMQ
ncbi:uncharacterized protein CTRU02_212106 [Colletotrichum truncatum]|uniref:Uncharacterized protein n=1 Tax=Colletotrichum truncatum TaxID=5467 RepID=A0ACC3YMM5_COLTU|nr:uncharacterized protein CTRU02_06825 [Colletotrichum truncatum]KAF6792207.1 hypothetical protein CTRU02_06825 [Colletotrichum truncatum]